jgi:hypothetical protein
MAQALGAMPTRLPDRGGPRGWGRSFLFRLDFSAHNARYGCGVLGLGWWRTTLVIQEGDVIDYIYTVTMVK